MFGLDQNSLDPTGLSAGIESIEIGLDWIGSGMMRLMRSAGELWRAVEGEVLAPPHSPFEVNISKSILVLLLTILNITLTSHDLLLPKFLLGACQIFLRAELTPVLADMKPSRIDANIMNKLSIDIIVRCVSCAGSYSLLQYSL